MPSKLFKKLTPHCIVLTANSRLTRYLQSAFDEYQKNLGEQTVWETPRILPLQSWLQQQFHAMNYSGQLLLTPFQEDCVWQEIIQHAPQKLELLHPAQMAKLVKQAWEYCTQWEVPLDTLDAFNTQLEVNCLIDWFARFSQRCTEHNWITACELPCALQTADAQKQLKLPHKIILIGFDDLNPNVKSLFAQFEKCVTIETEMLTANTIDKKQIVLTDTETEIKTMAQWAKALWDQNPDMQIGCVIPDLGKMRTKVQRIFTEFFSIEHINLSAGTALAEHNMIHTALTLLNWCHSELPIQALSQLLQSPYLCFNDDEKNMGAQMDVLLREQNRMQVRIADLYTAISILQSRYPQTTVLSRWRLLISTYQENKSAQLPPSQWATQFIRSLKAIEWPSHHTQNSTEFQVLERFKKVLMEFSQLDFIYPKLNYKRALQLLTTLTKQTIFQAKSHHEPIQIMGTLEASGILFDALWVTGMHDGVWPPATKPHPLIPYVIQQQYQMPHATPKREMQFCEHMTQRLENAAKQVIFSSPASAGDQLYFASRLIQHIPLIQKSDLLLADDMSLAEKIFHDRKMETLEDTIAPAMTQFMGIRGGSSILKLQALCPFRAFATIRLNAHALNNPVIGIPPVIKGILIHDILFAFWGEIQDQVQLNALTDDAFNQLIEKCIDKTFSESTYQTHQPHNHYFFSIEKKRLQILIKEWLTLEKSRPYFRVHERETECQLTIENLPIKMRLDRIDQLSDGSLFLIDYKTGLNSITGWFQERMSDPQLPLYAAFQADSEQPFSGISFAEIRTGEMKLKGVIHEAHLYAQTAVPGLIPIDRVNANADIYTWTALLENWKQSIETLSRDFCNGVALPDPIKAEVCLTCDLKPVCRYRVQSRCAHTKRIL
ncbi:MAG: hypothetical protein A3F13_04230 [Gammaproteobacteria bacterium RIFCSPHIGHO2_12_FULL_40_19]|nr:MAG: hypothetical protein A3F13_04230 [Gammaproteobacteria bacterium RIFCSPHIGHO2_12_FULL_40_19]